MGRWPFADALAAGLVATALAVAGESAAAQPDAATELEQVVERLNALDTWLDDAGKRLASKQKALATADRRVASAAGRIRDLNTRLAATQTALAGLEEERQQLEAAKRRHTEHLAEHARAAWRMADHDLIKLILNQQDPAAADRALRHHALLAKARAAAAEGLAATLADLEANASGQQREAQRLSETRTELTAGRKTLVADRNRQRTAIRGLQAEVAASSEERDRLRASRERLQQLVDTLKERTAETVAGTGLGTAGDLPWPVAGRVQASFGQPRAGGRMRWQGMVIAAEQGSAVRTVASGRVVFADWLRGFGMLAIVDHGDSYLSLYGHADALYKQADDRVEAGETIAAVGQSGGQGQVGLYFEIRKGGQPIDPRAWLQAQVGG